MDKFLKKKPSVQKSDKLTKFQIFSGRLGATRFGWSWTLNWKEQLSIDLMSRVFAIGPGDQGSIPGRVIPKTKKMVLDVSLLNTQHDKVRIKGKVKQSREQNSALPYTLV